MILLMSGDMGDAQPLEQSRWGVEFNAAIEGSFCVFVLRLIFDIIYIV